MPTPSFDASTPLFIVFNPGSGSGDKARNRQDMQKILQDANRRHEYFVVDDPAQIGEYAAKAARAAVEHNGAVIVAGGDGTINAVAAATLPTGRPFGLVPQGTFNYSSRAHGIPLETIPATQALLDARVKPVQVGRVNDRIFLVNASLGLYPQLLEDREVAKSKLGRKRVVALWAGLRTLATYHRQFVLEVEHDQQREVHRTPTLFVGNNPLQLEQVGLPEVQAVQHRRLAAVVIKPVSGATMLWLALRGALGKLGSDDHVRDFAFSEMSVNPGHGAARQFKVATDGEVCWMRSPLRFSVAEESLMLLVPAA
jgi:diacylglycerol kinase family enzyme